MKTTKHDVVKLICQMATDNEQMTNSILGNIIVEAAKESLKQPLNLLELKENLSCGLWIISEIEKIDHVMQRMRIEKDAISCEFSCKFKSMQFQDVERQRAMYIESLNKVLNKL